MSPLEYLATLLWSLVFIKMVWAEPFFDSLRFLFILPSPRLQPPLLKITGILANQADLKTNLLNILPSISLIMTQKHWRACFLHAAVVHVFGFRMLIMNCVYCMEH